MKTVKNKEIIDGIVAGDTAILKAFYRKNLPYVRKYILQNGGCAEDVEDVFQDALVLIYSKLRNRSIQVDVSVHSFFIGVCKNKWRSELRKRTRIVDNPTSIDGHADAACSITHHITERDQETLYHKYLATLSDSHKTFMNLFLEGKSMREIATLTGYTEGYARKKKFKIKEYLLQMIQNDPIYEELAMIG